MNFRLLLICSLITIHFLGCKKKPGEGGFASIEGKVYVLKYDKAFTQRITEHYLTGENVYIVYGNDTEIGNSVKTSYDGSFKFNFLRKGKYKIFVNGVDSTQKGKSTPKEVQVDVTISGKKQHVVLSDLITVND